MVKHAQKGSDGVPPRIPSFLDRCTQPGKRPRTAEGARIPFIPSWGICEQDSALGSPALALDWAKCSITPPDILTVTAGDKIEESELLVAQALYQVCQFMNLAFLVHLDITDVLTNYLCQATAYFRSASTQGRAF